MAYSYSRPDQLEIKCDALIFQAASYLKYHMSADAAYDAHTFFFYFLGRMFTAAAGTALIPIMALLAWRIFRNEKINARAVAVAAAGITSFSYLFIQHSAYATPDIPLTMFAAAIMCIAVKYLENGKLRDICMIAVLEGLAVTIKYPAALFAVFIALIIIYRAVCTLKEKRLASIMKRGFLCFIITLSVMFIMAPNLFTDFDSVLSALATESDPSHLGADGLGFLGNLKYYLTTVFDSFGIAGMGAFAAGIIYLILNRRREHIALAICGIYWILLSMLALHWVRWGFPMYVAYIIISAAGFVWVYSLAGMYIRQKIFKYSVRGLIIAIASISAVSFITGALAITVWSTRQDTRAYAADIVNSMGVNQGNCFCEAYTPLTMNGSGGEVSDLFELSGNSIRPREKYAGRQYFMTNLSYRERFYTDTTTYADVIKIYNMIPKNYRSVFRVDGSYVYNSRNELKNIMNCVSALRSNALTGSSIILYDLGTKFVTVRPYSDKSIYLMIVDNNGKYTPGTYYNRYDWTEYITGDTETIMSRDNDMVLTEQTGSDGSCKPAVTNIDGDSDRHWSVRREDGCAYIISSRGMALALKDGELVLEKYTGDNAQRWIIDTVK